MDKRKIRNKWLFKNRTKITTDVLLEYGNNIIDLRSTDDPNLWLLSFKGK